MLSWIVFHLWWHVHVLWLSSSHDANVKLVSSKRTVCKLVCFSFLKWMSNKLQQASTFLPFLKLAFQDMPLYVYLTTQQLLMKWNVDYVMFSESSIVWWWGSCIQDSAKTVKPALQLKCFPLQFLSRLILSFGWDFFQSQSCSKMEPGAEVKLATANPSNWSIHVSKLVVSTLITI